MPPIKMTKATWERIGKAAHWSKYAIDDSYADDPLSNAPLMTNEDVASLVEAIEQETTRAERAKNPLNDRSRESARNYARKVIYKAQKDTQKSIWNDNSWKGVHLIFTAMTDAGIDYNLTKAEYQHNDQGIPIRKKWHFSISYLDKKNKQQTLLGSITAAGAGTVADPLQSYDVVALVY